MKVIILAAGYATRLYPLTMDRAKPLLPIGGQPIINYIINGLSEVNLVSDVYIVTNNKFYNDFCNWKNSSNFDKNIFIINDGTKNDNDKLGAIGDINLVIKEMKIADDLMIIAGDNVFSFQLSDFVKFFNKNGLCIAAYRYPNKKDLSHYGILETDGRSRVVAFNEKPQKPKSNLVATCLYGIPKDKLYTIKKYIDGENNLDAPGYYLQWLVKEEDVDAFVFDNKWYDIGTPEAYESAQEEFNMV